MPIPSRLQASRLQQLELEEWSHWGQVVNSFCSVSPAESARSTIPVPAPPKPAAAADSLVDDLERLLRKHFSRLAGTLDSRLGKQEQLLLQLLEACSNPANSSDCCCREVQGPREDFEEKAGQRPPQFVEASPTAELRTVAELKRSVSEAKRLSHIAEVEEERADEAAAAALAAAWAPPQFLELRVDEQELLPEVDEAADAEPPAVQQAVPAAAANLLSVAHSEEPASGHVCEEHCNPKGSRGSIASATAVRAVRRMREGMHRKIAEGIFGPARNRAARRFFKKKDSPETPEEVAADRKEVPEEAAAAPPEPANEGGESQATTASQSLTREKSKVMSAAPARKAMSFTSNDELLKEEALTNAQPDMGPTSSVAPGDEMTCLQYLLSHSYFEALLCFLIISNTILFGVEVEMTSAASTSELPEIFVHLTRIYTVLFTIELVLRVLSDCCHFFATFFTSWNWLDTFVVISSIVEWVLEAMELSGQNLSSLRVIRMARVMRIVRVLRLMRFIRSLRILIHSVMNTVKSLFWTMLLLAMILYVFAILFTQASSQWVHEHKYASADEMLDPDMPTLEIVATLRKRYGSVGRSIFTLFKCITGGVSWQDVSDPLAHVHWIWVAVFVAYIIFTYLAVLNVVTGVFCQTAIESANYDQDMVVQEQLTSKSAYSEQLRKIFKDIDDDHTGTITLSQFERRLQDPTLQAYFDAVGLTVDEAWNLFKLLDTDESHIIDVEEFVNGCLRLRGAARTMDIAMLLYQSKWTMQRLTMMAQHMQENQDALSKRIEAIGGPLPTRTSRSSVASMAIGHELSTDSASPRTGAAKRRLGSSHSLASLSSPPRSKERPPERPAAEWASESHAGGRGSNASLGLGEKEPQKALDAAAQSRPRQQKAPREAPDPAAGGPAALGATTAPFPE